MRLLISTQILENQSGLLIGILSDCAWKNVHSLVQGQKKKYLSLL